MVWNRTQSSVCQSLSNQLDSKQSVSIYSLLFNPPEKQNKAKKTLWDKNLFQTSEWTEKAAKLRQCRRMHLTHTVAYTKSVINTNLRGKQAVAKTSGAYLPPSTNTFTLKRWTLAASWMSLRADGEPTERLLCFILFLAFGFEHLSCVPRTKATATCLRHKHTDKRDAAQGETPADPQIALKISTTIKANSSTSILSSRWNSSYAPKGRTLRWTRVSGIPWGGKRIALRSLGVPEVICV